MVNRYFLTNSDKDDFKKRFLKENFVKIFIQRIQLYLNKSLEIQIPKNLKLLGKEQKLIVSTKAHNSICSIKLYMQTK